MDFFPEKYARCIMYIFSLTRTDATEFLFANTSGMVACSKIHIVRCTNTHRHTRIIIIIIIIFVHVGTNTTINSGTHDELNVPTYIHVHSSLNVTSGTFVSLSCFLFFTRSLARSLAGSLALRSFIHFFPSFLSGELTVYGFN